MFNPDSASLKRNGNRIRKLKWNNTLSFTTLIIVLIIIIFDIFVLSILFTSSTKRNISQDKFRPITTICISPCSAPGNALLNIHEPTLTVYPLGQKISKTEIVQQETNNFFKIKKTAPEDAIKKSRQNSTKIYFKENILILDRTKPRYQVYKDGFVVNVSVELQWYIYDICKIYGFCEKCVYGMILAESSFQPTVSNGNCIGLCQINTFWITSAVITHFTDDYQYRDLKDPYDNLLTLVEMWNYAKDTYRLDTMSEEGIMKILYWHNSGKDPRYISYSRYADICMKYAEELISLQ